MVRYPVETALAMTQKPITQLEAMYRAHGSSLLAYLSRRFGHCAAPEDLLHETFVQALRRPYQVAAAPSPRAFLFGIARHLGLTALRRNQRLTIADSAADLETPAPLPVPQTDLADLRNAIALLPPQLRDTLELRLRDELSYEEIGAVLEIPVGTVRSRLHHALRQLQEKLVQEDPS